jgi:hypothetical protein
MSIMDRDYILKMIRQLAQALARIMRLRTSGELEEALLLVRTTSEGLFGPLARTLPELDAASAASLLGSRERIDAYAALTAEEAAIHETKREAKRARALHRRALELRLEAARLPGELGEEARAAIAELRAKVDEPRLDARYRSALARL